MGIVFVILAAFLAGAINAIAGGGTFLVFPALTGIAGLNEKVANMTSTIGLWPGSAASVVAARKEFARLPRGMVIGYALVSLIGGTAGSILLLCTSAKAFSLVVPWLLGFATLIFAMGKRISEWAGRKHGSRSPGWTLFVGAIQVAVAVYGGYFGAGIGVLMLAGLSFVGLDDLHQINALKVLLSTLINLAAALIFLFNKVDWRLAGSMAAASVVGGFLGMQLARRVPEAWLRAVILLAGGTLTVVYFVKNY